MALPSDEALRRAVNDILRNIDFDTTSLRAVLNMVAERFTLTPAQLAPKKPFVRSLIDAHLNHFYAHDDHPRPKHDSKDDSPNPSPKPESPPRKRAKRDVCLSSLERAVVPTERLAGFLGKRVMPRSHITKKISSYVRERKLETVPGGDERRYVCDDTLREVLGVESFTYYELSKLLSTLVKKPTECDNQLQELATECDERTLREKRAAEGKVKAEGEKRGAGLQRPMKLSKELSDICGEDELPRGGVVKKIWSYIRENGLKDRNDPMKVRCDDKLKAVFNGREYIVAMDVNKFIGGHMTKIP